MAIRPMREGDVDAVDRVAFGALARHLPPQGEAAARAARQGARLRHALATDPAGCWVAERADGVVGAALAIRREGLWGLSLLAVAEEVQGQGVGRPLLATALDHARGARGGLILSSTDPRAMRLYARSGFALRPCVGAAGIVEPHAVTAAGVQEPERAQALALTEGASLAVRGAAQGADLGVFLDHGARMLCVGDRGTSSPPGTTGPSRCASPPGWPSRPAGRSSPGAMSAPWRPTCPAAPGCDPGARARGRA